LTKRRHAPCMRASKQIVMQFSHN